MKKRVNAGSDIAAIGAWDASLADTALANVQGSRHEEALTRDAEKGSLFFIRIGADWGGVIDAYVDEEPPAEVLKDLKQVGREFHLSLATGRLVINGVEFYRTEKASTGKSDRALEIPAGDYALRFYESKSEGGIDAPRQKDLAKIVGTKDSKFFQSMQWFVVGMYVMVPVSFFAAKHFVGWKTALLPAGIVTGAAFVIISIIKSGERFKRVAKAQYELWRQAQDRQSPGFVFALRKIKGGEELKGGWVDLRKQAS